VTSVDGPATVVAEDLDGASRRVSLLALDPPGPVEPGEWLVVHSGYAVGRADRAEAEAAAALVKAAP